MANLSPRPLDKIVNPGLAYAALNNVTPRGDFKVYVKIAQENLRTSARMKAARKAYAPGLFTMRIPCSEIPALAADANVISIELREHITSGHSA